MCDERVSGWVSAVSVVGFGNGYPQDIQRRRIGWVTQLGQAGGRESGRWDGPWGDGRGMKRRKEKAAALQKLNGPARRRKQRDDHPISELGATMLCESIPISLESSRRIMNDLKRHPICCKVTSHTTEQTASVVFFILSVV